MGDTDQGILFITTRIQIDHRKNRNEQQKTPF
jgi:hypothetical protein